VIFYIKNNTVFH